MTTTTMTIATGRTACLHGIRGATISVCEGCVWITQEGCVADDIVHAGASFTVTRDGATVVTACRPGPLAEVRIHRESVATLTLGERMVQALRAMLAPARPAAAQ